MTNAMGIDYAADVAEMIVDAGLTCKVGGTSASCTAGEETISLDLSDDRDVSVFERSAMVAASSLSGVPARYTAVTIGSRIYSLIDVSLNEDSDAYIMRLRRVVEN